MEDLEAFARLVTALRPWLGQLVVVGGWAHRLHRFHRLAKPPGPPAAAHARHRPGLLTRRGSRWRCPHGAGGGRLHRGILRGRLTARDALSPRRARTTGFYAEFLTPLLRQRDEAAGSATPPCRRPASRRRSCGTSTCCLFKPWSVRVGPEQEVPIAADVDLFVPNPTSFIVQKLLIHPIARRDKRAQDVLYIHDTLELFGGSAGELRRLWVEEVRPAMPSKTARRAEAIARELFAEVTDTIRDAARIPQDRRLAPEDVQRACRYGLAEVLGMPEAD